MEIEITRLRLMDNYQSKAVASILINRQLAVHDIKVLELHPGKLVVAMPNQQDKYGKPRDVVHPITTELREQITNLLLTRYQQERTGCTVQG